MSRDELDERVRSLDAERARPDTRPPTVEELMQRLIRTLHMAYCTPPDRTFPVEKAVDSFVDAD